MRLFRPLAETDTLASDLPDARRATPPPALGPFADPTLELRLAPVPPHAVAVPAMLRHYHSLHHMLNDAAAAAALSYTEVIRAARDIVQAVRRNRPLHRRINGKRALVYDLSGQVPGIPQLAIVFIGRAAQPYTGWLGDIPTIAFPLLLLSRHASQTLLNCHEAQLGVELQRVFQAIPAERSGRLAHEAAFFNHPLEMREFVQQALRRLEIDLTSGRIGQRAVATPVTFASAAMRRMSRPFLDNLTADNRRRIGDWLLTYWQERFAAEMSSCAGSGESIA